MARDASWPVVWSQYLAARLAATALTCFDVGPNLRTAAAIGRMIHRFDRRHRRRAARHIALAFPKWNQARRDEVCVRSFEHFVQLAVEVCHTPRLIHRDSWPRTTRFANLGPAVELLNAGKPVILVTGHVGNWEVLGYLMAVLGYPVHALFRPLDNRLLNAWVVNIRRRRGLHLITKWDATDRMQRVLDEGGALAFIADQNAGDKGLFVPFFGRLASTYKSIGLLAMTTGVPIVCGYAQRRSPGYRFELGVEEIIRPEDWVDRADPLYYVTARFMRAIEQTVRRCPEQYLWSHRRWRSRPRFEREGKPMPATLRRKLKALPWIDDAAIEQLTVPLDTV